ncbi:MAG: NYN domain-containing protein [Gemmatimonadales bacterium]
MPGYTAVFIDGGYLDHMLRSQFGQARIDYGALVQKMAGSSALLRAYYYHCLPHQSNPATTEEKERIAGMQRFTDRLRRLEKFEVRLGKLAYRGEDTSGKKIFEQKRVDIMLAVDLVLLASKRTIDRAVLFTGDSDFLPAVSAAKNEGVILGLWHGSGDNTPHRDLWDAADERTQMTPALVDAIRRAY